MKDANMKKLDEQRFKDKLKKFGAKYGLLLALFFLITTVIFSLLWISSEKATITDVDICTTAACVHASSIMLDLMDETQDPCNDFNRFACGNYRRDFHATINKLEDNYLKSSFERNKFEKVSKLVANDLPIEDDDTIIRQLKYAYLNCIERNASAEFHEIYQLANEYENWPILKTETLSNNINLNNDIERQKLTKFLINPTFSSIYINVSRNRNKVYIYPPDIVDTVDDGLASLLLDNFKRLGKISESEISVLKKNFEKLFKFEEEYNNYLKEIKKEENLQFSQYWGIENHFAYVNWSAVLAQIDIDHRNIAKFQLYVANDYLEKMSKFFQSHSYSDIVSYAIWRWLIVSLEEIISKNDAEDCLKLVFKKLPAYVTIAYFDSKQQQQLDQQLEIRMSEIVRTIRSNLNVFVEKQETQEWLNDNERKALYEILDISKADVITLKDVLDEMKKTAKNSEIKLGEPFSRFLAHSDQSEVLKDITTDIQIGVKAIFLSSITKIPSTIIQDELLIIDTPDYLQYSGIGFVIAREFHDWLRGTILHFTDHLKSHEYLAELYDNYTNAESCVAESYNKLPIIVNDTHPEATIYVNGWKSLQNNIADIIGSDLAYLSYLSRRPAKELRLPGLTKYTSEQIFFLKAAQFSCASFQPSIGSKLANDSHAASTVRMNGALRNSKNFAKAYNCESDAFMNPIEKCSFWKMKGY